MSLYVAILGAVTGFGVLCIIRGMNPRLVRQHAALPGAQQGAAAAGTAVRDATQRAAKRIEKDLHNKMLLTQDAAMIGRALETHAVHKMFGLLVGGAGVAGLMMFFDTLLALGLRVPIIVMIALIGALLGWLLPDSFLRSEADKEREYFKQVSESWLELVAQLVTAGSDTFAALVTAASYSEQPGFVVLRNALRVAALSGEPPWTGLRRLADERRLRFLDPFCAALELAGTTGAGSRQAILAQVDAARSKAMLEADAAAASSSEKMGAPLALIGGAFMILMGYPPLSGILDTSSFGGL